MKMRKIMAAVMVSGTLLSLSACRTEPEVQLPKQIPYEALYKGASTEKHEAVKPGALVRASYGYLFNTEQGYNGFSYVAGRVEATRLLSWDGEAWAGDGASVKDGVVSSGAEPCGYLYQVPVEGRFTLEGTLRKETAGGNACSLEIYQNGVKIFPEAGTEFSVAGEDTVGKFFSLAAELKAGDELYFAVTGTNAYCNPAIVPQNGIHSLYTTGTKSGFYGDIHVYYHEDQVHLYHLWNYGTDTVLWEWDRQISTDMFRYQDASMDLSFVENHYMSPSPDLIDYPAYTGGRDCTKFYDADIDRYRYLALSYRPSENGNVSCALTLRTSRDSIGMDWSDPCIVLRDFPTSAHGEPECSQFKKIGNHWYLFTSVSGQTVHGVGTVQYFVGGEGQTIDEVDWLNAEPHYLDGEDLCVPQVEQIADRFYLYGWMPRVYNMGFWGGYKNLPREIYQRENGLLGSRMDPMATKLLNKGKYLDIEESTVETETGLAQVQLGAIRMIGKNNRVAVQKQLDSTFLQYRLDMQDSTQAGYSINCEGKEFRVLLLREGEKLYLQVDCPSDASHPVSSRLEIEPSEDGIYDIRCCIEGSILECFVNDTFALSARTSMFGKSYQAAFFSDAQASFTDIGVCRLAQMHDIYD